MLEEELCDRGAVEVAHMLQPTEIVNLDKGLTLTFEGMKEGGWGLREVSVTLMLPHLKQIVSMS